MSLTPRAIATLGIGYGPRLVALLGLWPTGSKGGGGNIASPFRRQRWWRDWPPEGAAEDRGDVREVGPEPMPAQRAATLKREPLKPSSGDDAMQAIVAAAARQRADEEEDEAVVHFLFGMI